MSVHSTIDEAGARMDGDGAIAPSDGAPSVLSFVRPVIGFPECTQFELRTLDAEYAPYRMLVSRDRPGLEFIVVSPGVLFDDYVIEIADADAVALGLEVASEVEVIVIVTAGRSPVPTVNLLGPIVINRRTAKAAQLVLQEERYGVAVPVDAASALG
jgi:flagellar assembly factor FliW